MCKYLIVNKLKDTYVMETLSIIHSQVLVSFNMQIKLPNCGLPFYLANCNCRLKGLMAYRHIQIGLIKRIVGDTDMIGHTVLFRLKHTLHYYRLCILNLHK